MVDEERLFLTDPNRGSWLQLFRRIEATNARVRGEHKKVHVVVTEDGIRMRPRVIGPLAPMTKFIGLRGRKSPNSSTSQKS